MKILLIPAKSKTKIDFPKKIVESLYNEKIGLCSSIQYLDSLNEINKLLPKSIISGQVLGCNVNNCIKSDSYLFIGSGKFHPIEIALKTKKKVYTFNPETKIFSQISKEEIKQFENKLKAKNSKFLKSKKIGILVSIKPGQNNLKKALQLQKKIKKESYIFIANEINNLEFENFYDIDFWVNTACPRIESNNLLHYSEINCLELQEINPS